MQKQELLRISSLIFILWIGLGATMGSPLITNNQDYSFPVTKYYFFYIK